VTWDDVTRTWPSQGFHNGAVAYLYGHDAGSYVIPEIADDRRDLRTGWDLSAARLFMGARSTRHRIVYIGDSLVTAFKEVGRGLE